MNLCQHFYVLSHDPTVSVMPFVNEILTVVSFATVTSWKFGLKIILYLELQSGVMTQLYKYDYGLSLCLCTLIPICLPSRLVHFRLWKRTPIWLTLTQLVPYASPGLLFYHS